eukprot:jgi/Botrbrau1/10684/Bobra.139_2s0014.1
MVVQVQGVADLAIPQKHLIDSAVAEPVAFLDRVVVVVLGCMKHNAQELAGVVSGTVYLPPGVVYGAADVPHIFIFGSGNHYDVVLPVDPFQFVQVEELRGELGTQVSVILVPEGTEVGVSEVPEVSVGGEDVWAAICAAADQPGQHLDLVGRLLGKGLDVGREGGGKDDGGGDSDGSQGSRRTYLEAAAAGRKRRASSVVALEVSREVSEVRVWMWWNFGTSSRVESLDS